MLCGSLDGRGVWQRTDTCLNMIESLNCSLETITTLLIGYTPIQNKSVLKINKKILCIYYSIRIIFLSFFFFFFILWTYSTKGKKWVLPWDLMWCFSGVPLTLYTKPVTHFPSDSQPGLLLSLLSYNARNAFSPRVSESLITEQSLYLSFCLFHNSQV